MDFNFTLIPQPVLIVMNGPSVQGYYRTETKIKTIKKCILKININWNIKIITASCQGNISHLNLVWLKYTKKKLKKTYKKIEYNYLKSYRCS